MPKPTLYGISSSRAIRAIWGIEETGIDYEHVPTNFADESKTPEYLAINPNGRIPALVDGDLVLFESMAINLYLTRTYAPSLYPDNPADIARADQWSVWGISEIEPLQMQLVIQKFFTPEDKRNQRIIDNAAKGLERPFKVLDDVLKDREWLLGADFSVADLNVAAVMLLLNMVQHDYSSFTNISRWSAQCYARPALAAAQARD
jgi:glutathione S-transferase